jgi:hypothetical protein
MVWRENRGINVIDLYCCSCQHRAVQSDDESHNTIWREMLARNKPNSLTARVLRRFPSVSYEFLTRCWNVASSRSLVS